MSAPIPKDVYHIGEVYTGENGARRPRTPVIRTTAPQDPLEPWIEQVSWTPRIFIYHNILTQEECDEIINLGSVSPLFFQSDSPIPHLDFLTYIQRPRM